MLAEGATGICAKLVPNYAPVASRWERTLYSAYAQHFLRTYVPAAYPRWYLDGVGALFSTIAVRADGTVDYATAPLGYREILKSYGPVDVGEILSGTEFRATRRYGFWTPFHAWLLAHYFLFSEPGPQRTAQFAAYMTADPSRHAVGRCRPGFR